ncbi:unnamed protein product [Hermetia illucens]|uniref:Lipase domain-containing protein n=2 Tax=Hermetia illucens TaxID=343691 RepID=A0A7R8YRE8_HERIL|nr:pancreatic triacylglycerol lipase-like isoform X3 [Hermetia illucens]XP_037903880.1 pancreatic triacylglycerol lipase-like isoform X3 [Hermetia illucens]XP_037903881.1 pancreatic triacylglycerol lipase-like isoform X3 [Hermetia illucens]CAD7079409.1 unnamed protein product [Hermetia illucens]
MQKFRTKARSLTSSLGFSKKQAVNTFIFYHGSEPDDKEVYELANSNLILQHPKFDNAKKTCIYIHGYLESPDVESVKVIVDAYLQRNDHNIIILDWTEDAAGSYLLSAIKKMRQLGTIVANALILMTDAGLKLENVHIVGHSLGGQMAGVIGREVKNRSGGSLVIKRLSALDPAFPGFYPAKVSIVKPISKDDAEFVDVIHTDAWLYGAPSSTGTVDFWPNGGRTLQPGCPRRNFRPLSDNDLSSHRRSWWFWAESVINSHPEKFNAVKAKSWSEFKAGKTLEFEQHVVMGLHCPAGVSGDYYLQTNGATPFARGQTGVVFSNERTKTEQNKT